MKILHVLANSYPNLNGYAVRSHMLIKSQSQINDLSVIALTSPWYPNIVEMQTKFQMDNVTYFRTQHPYHTSDNQLSHKLVSNFSRRDYASKKKSKYFVVRAIKFAFNKAMSIPRIGWLWVEEKILIKHFTRRIIEISTLENVDVIHAHTPYRVGLPAIRAARKLNLKFVYEMRGLWEDTAVASGRWKSWGLAYRRFRRMETKILKQADRVICISKTLRKDIISRGISSEKISVISNGVESTISDRPEVELPNLFKEIKEKVDSNIVVGYIGSLRKLEGVNLTAEAVSILKKNGMNVKFLVLSTKSGQDELRTYCDELEISENTIIEGPVQHESISPFFNLIDVFVVSRPDSRVTRLVTPLKPFEAMSNRCATIVSNLPALEEIVKHEETGLVYQADDAGSLAQNIARLIENPELRLQLGSNAEKWIKENRTWKQLAEKTVSIYR